MSRRDLVFSALLSLMVAASLGIKHFANDFSTATDTARLVRDLTVTLRGAGFRTAIEPHPYQSDVVIARRGDCALRVRDATLAIDADQAFRAQSASLPNFAYWHRGAVSDTPPHIAAQFDEYRARTAARLGFAASFAPPIAIAASRVCDIAALPLSAVRMHFRR